jgi:hypothetical protein
MKRLDTLSIPLTLRQWVEIYYSLDSKIAGIKSGSYGPDIKGDTKKWVNELADIMDEIEINVEV